MGSTLSGEQRVHYPGALVKSHLQLDDALRERITGNLSRFERRASTHEATPAAVAVVLTSDASGTAHFLITRRASRLRDHAGQWALPGGRVDPGETGEQTALRELHEELGVRLDESAILGCLDDYATRSGFVITPVVSWAGAECRTRPNPEEVAEVHRVPVDALDAPDVPELRRIPESDQPVLSIPLLDTHIHAPTAAVLFQFREVAIHGRTTRVAHFEQPVFAWK